MIGADVHVNLHPIGTDLVEKEEDKMRSIFARSRSHIVDFAMSHMRKAEDAPAVRTPAEDARPSATEAAAKVQTEWEEEESRRDFFAVGGSHQQRLTGMTNWQEVVTDRSAWWAAIHQPRATTHL